MTDTPGQSIEPPADAVSAMEEALSIRRDLFYGPTERTEELKTVHRLQLMRSLDAYRGFFAQWSGDGERALTEEQKRQRLDQVRHEAEEIRKVT